MADTGTTSRFFQFPRWAQIGIVVLAGIGLAFAIWFLATSQLLVRSAHHRNWQTLEIVAEAFSRWPDEVRFNADRQLSLLPAGTEDVTLGSQNIRRIDCTPKPGENARQAYFVAGDRPDQPVQLVFRGALPDKGGKKQGCFEAKRALDDLAPFGRGQSDFSNLLIVNAGAEVVAQVGDQTLPVTSIASLSSVAKFAKESMRALEDGKAVAADQPNHSLSTNEGVATIRIADTDYFAYGRPFTLNGKDQPCPGSGQPSRPPPSASTPAGQASQADRAESGGCTLYAIGLMPAGLLREAWYRPSAIAFVGFGLALLLVVALMPLARLVLIGGAEAVSRSQLAGILFGAALAAAVATLACLFAYDAGAERRRAAQEAGAIAGVLAERAGADVADMLRAAQACQKVPATTSPVEPAGKLPLAFENAGWFSPEGTKPADAPCGKKMSETTDIGLRRYFQALDGPAALHASAGARYTVAALQTQLTGEWRTIVAIRDDTQNTLVATRKPGSLGDPILPSAQRFLVVDGSDASLPVLFHSQSIRAGVEKFAVQGGAAPEVAQRLTELAFGATQTSRESCSGNWNQPRPLAFQGNYDGHATRFSACVIPGTRWIVMVYHRLDDIDRIAAQTTGYALAGWIGVAVPLALLCALVKLGTRCRWQNLWPFEAAGKLYHDGAIGMTIAVVPAMVASAAGVWYSVPLTIASGAVGLAISGYQLLHATPTSAPLTLRTEQCYRWFVIAALLCVAVAPAFAFWSDARSFSWATVDRARAGELRAAVLQRSERATDGQERTGRPSGPGIADDASAATPPIANVISMAWQRVVGLRLDDVRLCRTPTPGWACVAMHDWIPAGAASDARLDQIGVAAHRTPFPNRTTAALVLVLAMLLAGLLYFAIYHGLWALTGFGIPLDAVKWPGLVLHAPIGEHDLPLAPRTLLVAPQQVLRDAVAQRAMMVNLADELLPRSDADLDKRDQYGLPANLPAWQGAGRQIELVISGLDLLLRDEVRRRAALLYLERASSAVGRQTLGLEKLIVIVEMSPLERMLDAFRDIEDEGGQEKDKAREDLRWARLFQGFTTFSFAPIDKIDSDALDSALPDTPGNRPYRTLVEELRWLPGSVIDSTIANWDPPQHNGRRYPLARGAYTKRYTGKVITWAAHTIRPSTEAAAIDFLRSNLIEYYEQCWAASSLPERVVLDAIARSGYVNMRKAVALQSLVRRGLVILDPAPRLMNRSFALYIRQTERPGALQQWRARQRSRWSLAQVPIAILLPAAFLLFAIAAAESGQEVTALLPLLAAAAPALIGVLFRSRQGG